MFYRVYDTLCSFTRNVEVIRSFEKGIGFTNITIFFTSGGTDIISCFVGQNPTVPVYRGEIQTRNLGMAVESWNDEGVWGNPFIFFFSFPVEILIQGNVNPLMAYRGLGSAQKGYLFQAFVIWKDRDFTSWSVLKGLGNLSFRSVKGPKRVNRCI